MTLLLSLRFPLVAALAGVLVLGPSRCAQLTLLLLLLLLAAWAALWWSLRSPAGRRREVRIEWFFLCFSFSLDLFPSLSQPPSLSSNKQKNSLPLPSPPSLPLQDTIAFFHPNAAGGGGGERVLWCAVSALQRALPDARVLVLCDEKLSAGSLRAAALRTFGVELQRDVEAVPLEDVARLDPARHPRLTLVSQSLAGAALAFQGLRACCRRGEGAAGEGSGGGGGVGGMPALFVDTSGWSLSYFVAKAAGCHVAAYVHYPIVSSDMLKRVKSGGACGEEDGKEKSGSGGALAVAGAGGVGGAGGGGAPPLARKLRSAVKTAYYHAVASVYGAAGGACCDVAVANSSWTAGHLEQLWWRRPNLFRFLSRSSPTSQSHEDEKDQTGLFSSSTIVYPPCGVSSLRDLPLERAPLPEEVFGKRKKKKGGERRGEGRLLIALAQFRPEKNQATLLRALALARRRATESGDLSHPVLSARLALVGGVRDAADAARVEALRGLARELGLTKGDGGGGTEESDDDDVAVFVTNASREALRALLSSALGGLHAMVDEHFGICVVEYMAAGVVPVAHDSAGPRMDIVREEEEEEEEEEDEEEAEVGGGGKESSAAGTKSLSPAASKRKKRSISTGFLCSTEEEYADAISELLLLSSQQGEEEAGGGTARAGGGKVAKAKAPAAAAPRMAAAARRRAARLFSDERFDEGFVEALRPLLARVERGCREEAETRRKEA